LGIAQKAMWRLKDAVLPGQSITKPLPCTWGNNRKISTDN
jgi:hypothetical protein